MESGAAGSVAEDFQWTTGGDECIQHQSLIDIGGYSEVHQVFFEFSNVNN